MNQGSSKGSYWIAIFSSNSRIQEIAISLSNATCFAKFGLCTPQLAMLLSFARAVSELLNCY